MPSRSYLRRTQPHIDIEAREAGNDAHTMAIGVYDPEYVAMLYPTDARSGFPTSDLARVLSSEVSNAEKERILNRLQREDGTYLPSDLTDEDVFALVPPRFVLGDQVNIQRWRDYLASDVLPFMRDELKSVDVVPEINSPNNNDANNGTAE
nr:MAG TPA: hypothetical protein [Microviridae sp.]